MTSESGTNVPEHATLMHTHPQDELPRLRYTAFEILCPGCGAFYVLNKETPPQIFDCARSRFQCFRCQAAFSVRTYLELLPEPFPQPPRATPVRTVASRRPVSGTGGAT